MGWVNGSVKGGGGAGREGRYMGPSGNTLRDEITFVRL